MKIAFLGSPRDDNVRVTIDFSNLELITSGLASMLETAFNKGECGQVLLILGMLWLDKQRKTNAHLQTN